MEWQLVQTTSCWVCELRRMLARERVCAVAAQAGVQRFFGPELGESDDGRFAAVRVDVRLPGSVAAFAAGIFGRFLAGGDAFEMRILIEGRPDVGMTGFAGLAADVIGGERSGREQEQSPKQLHASRIAKGELRALVGKKHEKEARNRSSDSCF